MLIIGVRTLSKLSLKITCWLDSFIHPLAAGGFDPVCDPRNVSAALSPIVYLKLPIDLGLDRRSTI
jgi:hypothetical protein